MSARMATAAAIVKAFRERLLHAGYRHANSAGELVSQDGTTWVGTSYVHGEYSIHAWRRPVGYRQEGGEHRDVMRVHSGDDFDRVADLAKALAEWAKTPPADVLWPVEGLSAL